MNFYGLILLAVGGFALFMYLKSGKGKTGLPAKRGGGSLPAPTGERGVKALAINDVFQFMDQDFLVVGKLTYEDDGDEWWEFRLVDGDDERYLCVEEDDDLEVGLWSEIDYDVPSDGPPERIEWDGATYRCVGRGEARVTRDGKTGRKSGLSCRYWEYEGSAGELGVEQWGGSWETWIGRELREGSYDILPGDLVEG